MFYRNKKNISDGWAYGFAFQNIKKNKYNLTYSSVGHFAVTPSTKLPRIGETVMIKHDISDDLQLEGKVVSINYNYDIKWIVIVCECTEVHYIKK